MKLNNCDICIGLWGIYYLQGIVYQAGIINKVLLLILIFMQLGSFLKSFTSDFKKPVIASTCLLLLMYIVYGGLIIIFGDGIDWTSDSDYLKCSLLSLLPILFFYHETKKGHLTERRIMIYTILAIVVSILKFNYVGQMMASVLGNDEVTNNMGYMFVAIIPMLCFFNRRPLLQYVLLLVIFVYIILGMKRGAILIGAMSSLILLYGVLKTANKRMKLVVFLLTTVLILITVFYVENLLNSSDYFVHRIEQTMSGDSSARDEIYSGIWTEVTNETRIVPFLFGRGANSSIYYGGNYAHQDWLETFCNNGIIGVLLLSYFFFSIIRAIACGRTVLNPYMLYSFVILFILTFTKTLFSMSIQNMDMYQGMLIGYLTYNSTSSGCKQIVHRL